MRQNFTFSCMLIVGSLGLQAATARAQQGTISAHVHGQATMNIAIDGNHVEVELEAPGADLVGFEHKPRTPEQIEAVEAVHKKLLQAQNVMRFSDAAGCQVKSAKLEDADDAHEDGEHKDDAHEGHEDDAHKAEGSNDSEDGHSEFHVTYEFTCTEPSRLDEIQFTYFKSFPRASMINVNAIGKVAKQYKVTPTAAHIRLDGVR